MLCAGLTVKVIARSLGMKLPTVATHVSRAYKKLGVHNRTSALLVLLNLAQFRRPRRNGKAGDRSGRLCPLCGRGFAGDACKLERDASRRVGT